MADEDDQAVIDATIPALAAASPPSPPLPPPPPTDKARILSPKEVEDILKRDVYGQVEWYFKKAYRNTTALSFWTWTGFIFGFCATILAALPDGIIKEPINKDVIKWMVVIATAVTTLTTGTIVPRFRRLASSRENGRVKTVIAEKLLRTELTYRMMTDDQRCDTISKYIRQLMDVEAEFGAPDKGQGAETGAGK